MIRKIQSKFEKLSVNLFLLNVLLLIIPMSVMSLYMKHRYENYLSMEINSKVVEGLSQSVQEFNIVSQKLLNISSILANDEMFTDALQNKKMNFYTRTKCFDRTVKAIEANNLFAMDGIRITVFDADNNLYINWDANYNNYDFLLEQEWLQKSNTVKGSVTWNMFEPSYVIEANSSVKLISMARNIYSNYDNMQRIATIIISIEQEQLSKVLEKYIYHPDEFICLCTSNGQVVLNVGKVQDMSSEEIKKIMLKMKNEKNQYLQMKVGSMQYLVSCYTLEKPWEKGEESIHMLHFTNYQEIQAQLSGYSKQFTGYIMIFACILIGLVAFISFTTARPISILANKMSHYSINQQVLGLDFKRKDEIGHLNNAFKDMSLKINELFEKTKIETEERERYQFEALRAQVNPHFLFNTLNTIRWMAIIRQADNIVNCIDALASMLKFSMNRGCELVTLAEEIENIRNYVFIQNYRYGDRYSININIDEALMELQVIKFIMQPVVENSIVHAFKGGEKKKMVSIYGNIEGMYLKLFIEDNGKGIKEPDTIISDDMKNKRVTGLGLNNVNGRIRIAYGNEYGIKIHSNENQGTVVEYTLPILRREAII